MSVESGEPRSAEVLTLLETEKPKPKTGITITHHLPDVNYPWLSLEEDGGFKNTMERLREAGVTKQRFDIRWNRVAPTSAGETDSAYLKRCARIAEIGSEIGLDNLVVLSSAPKWALRLAKTDPDSFIKSYQTYIDTVFSNLSGTSIKPPSGIQIFNELNMRSSTPTELLPLLPRCVEVVRDQAKIHFGKELPVVATLQVSSSLALESIPGLLEGARHFIKDHQDLLQQFDQIDLDYYPGIWHQPKEAMRKHLKNIGYYRRAFSGRNDPGKVTELQTPLDVFRTFGDMELLKHTLDDLKPLAERGIKIGIGEVGIPSISAFETEEMKKEHQKLQTVGLGIILRRLRPIVENYNLTGVGIYSLMDEPGREVGLFNWGLYDNKGNERHFVKDVARFARAISRLVTIAAKRSE